MSQSVKLVWATPEAEHFISDMARVSAPKNQGNYDTASRLIKYLIKHRHWSPFEMASMCVEIETTRGISPQILRHRSFSFQEFSQRYADTKELCEQIPLPELRRQDTKNRQNSTDDLDPELFVSFQRRGRMLFDEAQELYNDMIEAGVAKESARFFLPIATPTRLYMTGNLRSWIHYIDLRCSNGTQKEHMDIANAVADIFAEQFPSIYQALEEIKGEPEPQPEPYIIPAQKKAPRVSWRQTIKEWLWSRIFPDL
jgi:thymidylate synthase (FAD)